MDDGVSYMKHINFRWMAIVCTLILGSASPALAQRESRRAPHQGSSAVEGEVGIFMPTQSGMTTGPTVEGAYEYYLSARNSLRIGAGWANPKTDVEKTDGMRQVRIGADLVHNWEGGAIHPFVGAGAGSYFLQPIDNGGSFGQSNTRLGARLLGGVEFFTSRTFAVKGEARYDAVTKANGYNPSGMSLSIGVKSYF
jgi:hypothetical protein